MNKKTFKVLRLLVETGSATASEIIKRIGTKNPYCHISTLRKIGLRICDRQLWGNDKVYFSKEKFNIQIDYDETGRALPF